MEKLCQALKKQKIAVLIILIIFTAIGLSSIPVFAKPALNGSLFPRNPFTPQPAAALPEAAGITSDLSIILSRPTDTEMTVSITPNSDMSVYIVWGESKDSLKNKSAALASSPKNPAVFVMDHLKPGTVYYYCVNYKKASAFSFLKTDAYSFTTPRNAGSDYTFEVQSDSHLLNRADTELYKQSLEKMAGFNPDFVFDLGDTFINDQSGKRVKNPGVDTLNSTSLETVREHYTQQLPYLSIVAKTAPLFLSLGNHEGEHGGLLDGTDKNLAVKSTLMRKTYYPNPVPNSFYSGNTETEPYVGAPENYYAFEWGDALYVSIDPYRYSAKEPATGWDWTLGKEQYDWFRKTLEESQAKYKFVFAHHADGLSRGGAETAQLYEWGGYDKNGSYSFDSHRPGWGKPIQQIMKDTGVTIFFQGHDHLFAMENVDGVIYQTLPKPAESVRDPESNDSAYPNADKLVNSGFLKINVTDKNVQVDYVRTYCMLAEADQTKDTGVVYSYTVDAQHNVNYLKRSTDDFSNYATPDASGVSGSASATSKSSIGAAGSYPIVDTGVTAFYSAVSAISQPQDGKAFYGQDAQYQKNMPSYTDNGNGTITDNVTGLMWQQDMGEKVTFDEAFSKAASSDLGGYTDWRVPTIKELYSLIQFTGQSQGERANVPYIDTDYFSQPIGNTALGEREIDAQTWSATEYTGKTMGHDDAVFGVNFIDGRIKGYGKISAKTRQPNKMYIRLVRGNPDYGKNNFIDNGDGTVTDLATGLMWQQADDGKARNWQESLEYAENLTLAGHSDWRLPNAKELQSIVDYTRSLQATNSAAIDPLFTCSKIIDPNGKTNYPYYWTSTTHLDGPVPYGSAVYIAFGEALGKMNGRIMDVHGAGAQRSDPKEGNAADYPKYMGPQGDMRVVFNYVRCVRNIN